jgi:hypothetical protein
MGSTVHGFAYLAVFGQQRLLKISPDLRQFLL